MNERYELPPVDGTLPYLAIAPTIVLDMANHYAPGWRAADIAPDTLAGLTMDIERGSFTVWNGASERTIWGRRSINHAFRAWHDAAHYLGQYDFNRAGETATLGMQERQLVQYMVHQGYSWRQIDAMKALLRCEILGQLEYQERNGEFPNDQRAFAIEWLRINYSDLFC